MVHSKHEKASMVLVLMSETAVEEAVLPDLPWKASGDGSQKSSTDLTWRAVRSGKPSIPVTTSIALPRVCYATFPSCWTPSLTNLKSSVSTEHAEPDSAAHLEHVNIEHSVLVVWQLWTPDSVPGSSLQTPPQSVQNAAAASFIHIPSNCSPVHKPSLASPALSDGRASSSSFTFCLSLFLSAPPMLAEIESVYVHRQR